jgi:DsbC/DsbD-like thiol-disulfide interchange protein
MTRTVLLLFASLASAADWSQPVEARHDDALAVSYTARVDGPYLVVRATVGEGWHTFSLDNEKRVTEKLAGQPALSMDKPTEIAATGLEVVGGWLQSPPKEFSRPELRMYAFGYDREATFAAKVRRAAGPAKLRIRGQACTATICKNVDVALTVPVPAKLAAAAEVKVADLQPVR